MKILTPLLFPFAVLYDVVTRVRNRLYDMGVHPSASFDVPVISVGNLSVGGTGKSPMIEYLVRLLKSQYLVATLSRGYGRKTKGMRFVRSSDSAETVGDEPLQFYRKFKDEVIVAVGEDRAFAIPEILQNHEGVEVILLDDAFQHRRVKPAFQILLTDYHRLFTRDWLLPAGRLRESKNGAARADVIVVTKCPQAIGDEEMMNIEKSIRPYSTKAVFFSSICYGTLLPAGKVSPYKPSVVVLIAGIADPGPLIKYVSSHYKMIKSYTFTDHHHYSFDEINRVCEVAVVSQGLSFSSK